MLQVKEAVQLSLKTFEDLFSPTEHEGLRLEEVNLDEDHKTWSVTFSYKNPDFSDELISRNSTKVSGMLSTARPPDISARFYKTIKLKADDGSLLGIRNEWDLN